MPWHLPSKQSVLAVPALWGCRDLSSQPQGAFVIGPIKQGKRWPCHVETNAHILLNVVCFFFYSKQHPLTSTSASSRPQLFVSTFIPQTLGQGLSLCSGHRESQHGAVLLTG